MGEIPPSLNQLQAQTEGRQGCSEPVKGEEKLKISIQGSGNSGTYGQFN